MPPRRPTPRHLGAYAFARRVYDTCSADELESEVMSRVACGDFPSEATPNADAALVDAFYAACGVVLP